MVRLAGWFSRSCWFSAVVRAWHVLQRFAVFDVVQREWGLWTLRGELDSGLRGELVLWNVHGEASAVSIGSQAV